MSTNIDVDLNIYSNSSYSYQFTYYINSNKYSYIYYTKSIINYDKLLRSLKNISGNDTETINNNIELIMNKLNNEYLKLNNSDVKIDFSSSKINDNTNVYTFIYYINNDKFEYSHNTENILNTDIINTQISNASNELGVNPTQYDVYKYLKSLIDSLEYQYNQENINKIDSEGYIDRGF